MRILVIEDELQLSGHICRALGRHGHILRAESDGAAGLKAALSDPPDLVILDLMLPDMDGYEVLKRLAIHPLRTARHHRYAAGTKGQQCLPSRLVSQHVVIAAPLLVGAACLLRSRLGTQGPRYAEIARWRLT